MQMTVHGGAWGRIYVVNDDWFSGGCGGVGGGGVSSGCRVFMWWVVVGRVPVDDPAYQLVAKHL